MKILLIWMLIFEWLSLYLPCNIIELTFHWKPPLTSSIWYFSQAYVSQLNTEFSWLFFLTLFLFKPVIAPDKTAKFFSILSEWELFSVYPVSPYALVQNIYLERAGIEPRSTCSASNHDSLCWLISARDMASETVW